MVIYQPLGGYCYNSDTHFLFDFIVENLKKFKHVHGELLDIGSGSGILGILMAKYYEKMNLHQCEVQKVFQFLSTTNARTNHIPAHLYAHSLLDKNIDKTFDIIVSNPPFYHQNVIQSNNKNIKIARYNNALTLNDFIVQSAKLLNAHGKLFFCYDVKQFNDIIKILNENNLNIEAVRFVHPKSNKDATLVMVYARKNSKSLLHINPPLIMFENESYTQEVNDIYNLTSTHSIKCDILEQFDE
ncbi:MAG: methyltransferase [Campylobacterota bacterium]|nr:methyltransferase [Campylobacterota bacterium]